MKKIFLVFTLLLIGLLSLVSCGEPQKEQHDCIIVRSKIVEHFTTTSKAKYDEDGKLIKPETVTYYIAFYERKRKQCEVSQLEYNTYDDGDYYTLIYQDCEGTRQMLLEYFNKSSITYTCELWDD